MTEEEESRSIDRVVDELHLRFPGVPTVVIQQTVIERYRQFDGAPVREYIPVMVKRSAKESLSVMVRGSRETFGRQFSS